MLTSSRARNSVDQIVGSADQAEAGDDEQEARVMIGDLPLGHFVPASSKKTAPAASARTRVRSRQRIEQERHAEDRVAGRIVCSGGDEINASANASIKPAQRDAAPELAIGLEQPADEQNAREQPPAPSPE